VTIHVNEWYRVKASKQFCLVQRIPSTTDPQVSVQSANENTRGFELALTWFEPVDDALEKWTKRVMIFDIKKAVALFRAPNDEDRPIIDTLKAIGHTIPILSASRDGEFTLPQQ
jgi:hypothetical protein